MKTEKSIKVFDRGIKKRVQALDSDIPLELEAAFLEKLEKIVPEKSHRCRQYLVYYGVLAAAATIILAVLLFIFPLFYQQIDQVEAGEVWIHAARVEGQPAYTFIINQKDPEMTIVWIEKIENITAEDK